MATSLLWPRADLSSSIDLDLEDNLHLHLDLSCSQALNLMMIIINSKQTSIRQYSYLMYNLLCSLFTDNLIIVLWV